MKQEYKLKIEIKEGEKSLGETLEKHLKKKILEDAGFFISQGQKNGKDDRFINGEIWGYEWELLTITEE